VTLLNADGTVAAGPNNSYVTDDVQQLIVTPDVLAGDSKQVVGGCDCVSVSYRGYDKLMRFNLELDLVKWETSLISMMTGAPLIMDSSTQPVPKGLWFPQQDNCAATFPKVAVEAWSDMWEDDGNFTTVDGNGTTELQFIHWIFPASHWHIDATTLQNDFSTPKLVGFTRSNPNFGLGPYGDLPEAAQSQGGFFWTGTRPTAHCGFTTASS
jgi:hypothetical protein